LKKQFPAVPTSLTAVTVVLVLKTRLNPLWLLAGGAVLGMAGVVPLENF